MEHRKSSRHGSRLVLLLPLLPLAWALWLSAGAFRRGDAGFAVELGHTALAVHRVRGGITPVRPGDRIRSLDGVPVPRVLGSLFTRAAWRGRGERITVLRDGARVRLRVGRAPLGPGRFLAEMWPHLAAALVLVLCGVLAFVRAPPGQPAGLFLSACSVFALNGVNEIALAFGPPPPRLLSAAFLVAAITNWLGFALWGHFVLRFPRERSLLEGRPLAVSALYWFPPATALGGALAAAGLSGEAWGWIQRLRFWHAPVLAAGMYAKELLDFRSAPSPLVRNQLKWPLFSVLFWAVPYCLLYALPILLGGEPAVDFRTTVLFGLAVPVGFLLSLVRYRMLDVDEILTTGLAYGATVGLLLGVYAGGTALGAGGLLVGVLPGRAGVLAFLVLAALVFEPLKERVRRAVDRWFFREPVDPGRVLQRYTRLAAGTLDSRALIRMLTRDIPADLGVARAAVLMLDERRSRLYPESERIGSAPWPRSRIGELLRSGKREHLLCEADADPDDPALAAELGEIAAAGYSLVLPLRGGASTPGLWLLGPKGSGRLYTRRELRALGALARSVAVAMENALMVRALEESKAQLEELYERVLRASRLSRIGEMGSVLAHEIRNPLGIIRSSAQLLLEGKGAEAERAEVLRFIVEEADRLNEVVESFLGLARLKSPEFEPVLLDRLVEETVGGWVRSADHDPAVAVSVEGSPGREAVYADPGQVRQILLNLLRNAEEAMPDGGEIRVILSGDEGHVALEVADTGPGVPPEVLPSVFERFFTTKEGGLGLGLAVCRQMAEAHNGTIRIESTPGRGTRVVVRLPRRPLAGLGVPTAGGAT